MIVTEIEYLTIDGVPTCTPAWQTLDHQEFWAAADPKGQDRELAGGEVIANRRSGSPSVRMAPMLFDGRFDPDGVAVDYSSRREQAWANYRLFKSLCVDFVVDGDGTREIELYAPDGSVLVGRGHVLGPFIPTAPSSHSLRATLLVSLPDGALTEDVES